MRGIDVRKIRTTMQPDTVIEVTEQEYTDLSRQGLIAGEQEDEQELTPTTLARAAAKVTKNTEN